MNGLSSAPSAAVSTVPSSARAMPKSITRGPSAASSTLPGLRSRCTRPQAWMARSASASPAASLSAASSGSAPGAANPAVDRPRGGDLAPELAEEYVVTGQVGVDDLHCDLAATG